MMSKSKPTTPLQDRKYYEDILEERNYPNTNEHSRIPIPSPGTFRRSSSMRLRGERRFSTNGVDSQFNNNGTSSNGCRHFPVITEASNNISDTPKHGISANKSASTPSATKDNRRHRSLSLSLQPVPNYSHKCRSPLTPSPGALRTVPRTPPATPDSPENGYLEDDLDSLQSYSSIASVASCDHAYVARNGTTFSGRKMKYVVHCSSHAGQTGDEYLTPTQRAQRQIRRLKALLGQARCDLEQKDSDIFRLTKEVVELRLYKASLCSPEERSNSSDAVTVRENTVDEIQTPDSPCNDLTDDCSNSHGHVAHIPTSTVDFKTHHCLDKLHIGDMQSSFADSGHFEDITSSSVHSKDSAYNVQMHDKGCEAQMEDAELERRKLIELYENKIDELARSNDVDTQELKKTHNDRVEAILQKLSDVNNRYCELVPDYEQAKERIRDLEKQLEEVYKQLQEHEEKQKKMYLQMYTKGQEAARIEHADRVLEFAHVAPNRVSVPELLEQLQVTQHELDNIRDVSYSPERHVAKTQTLLSAKEAVSLWVLGARKAMYRRIVEAQGSTSKIDPEVTLQFLKSAIYYFLTDKENNQGHLNAIESILGFSETEKLAILKARYNK